MDKLVENLRALLRPEQVISEPEELLVYECDGLTHYRHRPRAVLFPASTEEVAEVLKLLARERVPLVPRGAGTSPGVRPARWRDVRPVSGVWGFSVPQRSKRPTPLDSAGRIWR